MDPCAKCNDQRADVVAPQDLVDARLLHVEQLAAQREDCLEAAIASLLCGTTGRLALHNVELRLCRIALLAVGKFSWQCTPFKRAFAQHKVARLARRFATTRRIQRLSNHLFTVARVLFKELQESSVDRRLHNPLHFGGAELRLCLAFKLRVHEFYGDDGGQPFAHILTSEVWVVVFDRAILSAPVVERAGERCAESGHVRSAINGVDVVCKREQCFGP